MPDSLTLFRICEHDELPSTNDAIKQAIDAGAPEGEVVCARVQTAGYGRQGRAWKSPEGGLYLSVLLRPAVPPAQLPTLSLVVGIAVRRALAALTGSDAIKVKWPNDVVLEAAGAGEALDVAPAAVAPFRKLCGISSELHGKAMCVGIGVNVEAPAELCAVGGKNAAAYTADLAAGPVSIVQVRDAVLGELARCYERWQAEGFAAFAEEYGRCAALTGRQVRVERADGSDIACGTVQGVDEAGALIVQDGRRQVPVTSGEAHITQL